MTELVRTDYLKFVGSDIIDFGYNIIPIPPKAKSPGFDGWRKIKSTKYLLDQWLSDGMEDYGIGIITGQVVAIDLDITDESLVKELRDYIELNLGTAPVRIGRAPKCILLFKTESPFRKMKTGKFQDEWNDRHEVEILADGQQFVAFGLHQDTGRPYHWVDDRSPATIAIDDLPEITAEDAKAIIIHAQSLFKREKWEKVSGGLISGTLNIDENDPFAEDVTQVDLPPEEIRFQLMKIRGNEDYERWREIGMALFHQFDGGEEGLEMWHEWSESADNYDHDELDKKWESFRIDGKNRAPITARTIIKLAKEETTAQTVQKALELRTAFYEAKDMTQWRDTCARTRRAEIDSIARSEIGEIARASYARITGVKISMVEMRKAIAYDPVTSEKTARWLKDWVFDTKEDRFYHLISKCTMSIQSFNMVHQKHALTKKDIIEGRTVPSRMPVELALDIFKIPEVHGRIYAPSEDSIFHMDGIRVANTYPEYQVPQLKREYTPRDKWAIRIVKNHIKHLLTDPKEQELFVDWLAWIVQNPGKRVNWAMVLQGTQGDGKSFFGFLLREVMGVSNVRMVNANILEGQFNGWSHGQCVVVVEEPRLQGHNRYDVLNKIKPLITNPIIEIHPKGKDPYNVINTCSYFLPTNFRDALPLGEDDRRHCVLFSRWQNRAELRNFIKENPDYYSDLYQTISDMETVRALRTWLIDHEVSGSFPGGGDAPMTKWHSYMVDAAKPETIRAIQEIIDEGQYPDITNDLVNATLLPNAMIGRDGELPQTSGLTRLLEHNGYTFLGRLRVQGEYSRFWSKTPEMFRKNMNTSTDLIRKYIEERKNWIESNVL